jgi:hypothetical protein
VYDGAGSGMVPFPPLFLRVCPRLARPFHILY